MPLYQYINIIIETNVYKYFIFNKYDRISTYDVDLTLSVALTKNHKNLHDTKKK